MFEAFRISSENVTYMLDMMSRITQQGSTAWLWYDTQNGLILGSLQSKDSNVPNPFSVLFEPGFFVNYQPNPLYTSAKIAYSFAFSRDEFLQALTKPVYRPYCVYVELVLELRLRNLRIDTWVLGTGAAPSPVKEISTTIRIRHFRTSLYTPKYSTLCPTQTLQSASMAVDQVKPFLELIISEGARDATICLCNKKVTFSWGIRRLILVKDFGCKTYELPEAPDQRSCFLQMPLDDAKFLCYSDDKKDLTITIADPDKPSDQVPLLELPGKIFVKFLVRLTAPPLRRRPYGLNRTAVHEGTK